MDEAEARELLAAELTLLRELPYDELVGHMLDRVETKEVVGASGTRYQVELEGRWDDHRRPRGNVRILGAIDDGTLRGAFRPCCDDFLMAPDGTFPGD